MCTCVRVMRVLVGRGSKIIHCFKWANNVLRLRDNMVSLSSQTLGTVYYNSTESETMHVTLRETCAEAGIEVPYVCAHAHVCVRDSRRSTSG
jgi:hypothetical protein